MIARGELETLVDALPENRDVDPRLTLRIVGNGKLPWYISRYGSAWRVEHLALPNPVHLRSAGAVVDLLTGKAAPTPADLIAAAPYRITCE